MTSMYEQQLLWWNSWHTTCTFGKTNLFYITYYHIKADIWQIGNIIELAILRYHVETSYSMKDGQFRTTSIKIYYRINNKIHNISQFQVSNLNA